MRASRLIAETNPLAPSARTAAVIAHARSLGPGAADALVDELRAGDRYARELGLLVATGAARVDRLGRYLDDADVSLRIVAASALARFVEFNADAAVAYATTASADERRGFISAVLRERRRDLAEALLPVERGAFRTTAAARLLAVAGADVVRECIDDLLPSLPSAAGVAIAHPALFLEHARRDIEGLPPSSWASWWQRRSAAVRIAVRAGGSAEQAFELVEGFAPATGWVRWHGALLGELAGRDLDRLVAAIVASPGVRPHLSRRVLRVIGQHTAPAAVAFARQLLDGDRTQFRRLVLAVPPDRRAALFTSIIEARGATPRLEKDLLAALPAAVRVDQARETLAQLTAAGEPLFTYQARLPFAEAEPLLRPLLSDSLAELRGAGYRTLLESVGYSNDAVAVRDLLESFTRLPNEQEPVRSAALAAISELPLRLLDDRHVPALTRIVDDAYTARDHSAASASAIRSFASRLLGSPSSTGKLRAFAIDAMQRSNGAFFLPSLESLSPAVVEQLVAAFLPLIDEHEKIDRYDVLFVLVGALGRRAYGVAALDERLERATASRDAAVASAAIRAFIAAPRTRTARVRSLVARDRSVLALPEVERVVGRSASDLLTRSVLGGSVRGRFSPPRAVWLPPTRFSSAWTGEQRRIAAERLAALTEQPSVDLWVQFRCLGLLSYLPEYGLRPVLAAANSPVVMTAEKGLELLGRFGADSAVDETLAEALVTDRARVAGPALVRRAGILRPAELQDSVRGMLRRGPKVTSRKLLAFAVSRAALADPWDLYDRVQGEQAHPDVRAAVAAAQRNRLADPRAVALLVSQLASDGRGAGLIGGIDPVTVSSERRNEVAIRLAALCDAPVADTRSRAARAAIRWVAFAEELRAAIRARLGDVNELPTSIPFAGELARDLLDSGHPEGFRQIIADLLGADAATPVEADSLARERIAALLDPFGWSVQRRDHPATAPELEAVVDLLVDAGSFAIDACAVALRLLLDAPTDRAAARLSDALDDRAAVAIEVVETAGGGDVERLDRAVPLLVAVGGEAELVMAVQIVELAPDRYRAVLGELRASPYPEVRERARRVRTY